VVFDRGRFRLHHFGAVEHRWFGYFPYGCRKEAVFASRLEVAASFWVNP